MGEFEVTSSVTVTPELDAQGERARKQKREEKAACSEGPDKDPEPEDGA